MTRAGTQPSSNIFLAALPIVNGAFVLGYLLTEDITFPKKTIIVFAVALVIMAMGSLRLKWENGFTVFFSDMQLAILSLFMTCLLIQLVYWLSPSIFPMQIRNLTRPEFLASAKKDKAEYLPYSPYVKPKPDTLIRAGGYCGPESDFVYEWKTDKRGFKNTPQVAALEQVPIVALGDSFTEGMGVRTEETWAALLSSAGYNTYSLGVQGYGPSQMSGAFEHYGMALRPKWVLIGYLTGIGSREQFYLKKEVKEHPRTIGRLLHSEREIRKQYRYVMTGLLKSVWQFVRLKKAMQDYIRDHPDDLLFMPENQLRPDKDILLANMRRYRYEFKYSMVKFSPEQMSKMPEWQRTLSAFKEIIENARRIGARTAIVMFYNRPYIYFKRATGKDVPADVGALVERELLKKFCHEQSIPFIDTWQAFTEYTARLNEKTPMSAYPYFSYDGHPSRKGHELIRDILGSFFESQGMR